MKYSGELCPWCGNVFTEDDDIVVCPECGTPHHRSCMHAHAGCAHNAQHSEGFTWKPSARDDSTTRDTEDEPAAVQPLIDEGRCPYCGEELPEDGNGVCPNCGRVRIKVFNAPGAGPVSPVFKPDFDPNEKIGEITSGDIALACRTGANHYIKSFRKFEYGASLSFNIGAFVFAPHWFLYRKLYKAAAIFISVFLALNIWLLPQRIKTEDFVIEMNNWMREASSAEASEEELQKEYDSYMKRARELIKPCLPPILLLAAMHIVAAFTADRMYRKRCLEIIKDVDSGSLPEHGRQIELFRRGGTSFLLGAASYFGCRLILEMVIKALGY